MAKRRIYLDEATRNYGTGQPDGIIDNIINSVKEKYSKSVAENIKRKAKEQNLTIDIIRRRLYDNLSPYSYSDAEERLNSAIFRNVNVNNREGESLYGERDDTFAEYLGIPKNKRHKVKDIQHVTVVPSKYSPTVGREQNSYKTLNFPKKNNNWYWLNYGENDTDDYKLWNPVVSASNNLAFGKNKVDHLFPWAAVFADHTIGRGVDKDKGEYRSVYDLWDLAPTTGYGKDESEGLGKPVHFYDRVYLKDYYGLQDNEFEKTRPKYGEYYGGYIPEVIINGNNKYSLGGRVSRLKYGGKVPPIAAPYLAIRGGLKKVKDYIANRAYNTVNPGNSYDIPTVIDAFVNPNNHPEQYDDDYDGIARGNTDELYAMYLGIPTLQRHTNKRLNKSKYKKGEYALNLDDYSIKSLITQGNPIPLGKNKIKHLAFADLNESAVGRGHDAQGEYISYGDRYDLNPFRGTWATMKGSKVQKALEHFNDLSFGLFNPVDIYGRIYLDDYYNVPKKYRGNYYLPEVEVWPTGTGIVGRSYVDNYKLGGTIRPQFKYGGIHIKKKNRGKFTATMKRTGKSAEELSHSKNPLTRKRAIFALNARKWNRKKK